MQFETRTAPTFYFIGVTTGKSSINRIFPKWMEIVGQDVQLAGIDVPLHASTATYRAIVEHIKHDPLVRGALVTTHKIDLYTAAYDLFDELDANAQLCGEVSCIAKRDGKLLGFAKDPLSSGKAWDHLVPAGHISATNAEVLCFGSGGAAVATTVWLSKIPDRPKRFTLVDVSRQRLNHAREIHENLAKTTPLLHEMRRAESDSSERRGEDTIHFDYILNGAPYENDARMSSLPPGSVVINGTGMGKDVPGSPITAAGIFPQNGYVWEFNYRGELNFLHQAWRQAATRKLTIEDGWVYFLHGWTLVVAEALQFDLTPELFTKLDVAARQYR